MTREIVLRPLAKRDIREQVLYLDERSSDAGGRYLLAIERTLGLLAEQPEIGRLRRFRGRTTEIREWRIAGFEKYLVFYWHTRERLEVSRVIHAARDLEAILGA